MAGFTTPAGVCGRGAQRLPARLAWLLLALGALATPSEAATFNYLPTPVDVSPGVFNAWTDVNVSAQVPAGATGVIIQWVNPAGGASDLNYGVRMKGSTDNWAFDSEAKDGQQGWLMTGLDAARVFQVFVEAAGVQTYLVGYTMSGVKFFTNRIDKSTATTATWVDVSIAANTPTDTAIGAIFHVDCQAGSSVGYGLRKKGSTDNLLQTLRANMMNLGIVGVDATETAQQQIAATTVDLFLVGYVTSGAVFFTNAIDKSTGTTGSYQDVDITNDVGAGVANGAFVEIQPSDGTRRLAAIRPNGSSYDYYAEVSHQSALVGLDAGDIFEQKIEQTTMDLYLTGYSLADGAGVFRVKTGSYVGTGGALSITGLGFQPDVVIVDGVGGGADSTIKTSTMGGANSKLLDNGSAFDAVHITSLDADGFGLGTDPDVNQAGITYYWVAMKAAPGAMKVGTYAGSAGAQNVTGVGFTPDYVIVMSPNVNDWPMQRSSLMPNNFCLDFAGAGYNNSILNMQPNGFGLGTHDVAGAGTTFHYVAWARLPGRIAVGSYAGNKVDDRNITGVGFQPEYLIVDRSNDVGGATGSSVGNAPVHKTAASGVATDSAALFNGNVAENDNVQALQADGFQVGTHCRVNGDGTCNAPVPVTYYYAAFGPHTARTYYRSVGTSAANLNVSGRTVTVSGNTATFSGSMPANVGVGDVLQYQVTGTYYLAFVSGRTSSTVYSVVSATGGAPQPAAGGTAVGVYRAYTALSAWEAQNESTSIDLSVRNFDTSRDLVAADAAMLVACYNDGPMDDTVSISNSWITSANNLIRVFTPVATSQVGASQRHTGVAGTGFRMTPVLNGGGTGRYVILGINTGYVRVEGLEIDGTGVTASQYVKGINIQQGLSNVGDIRIDSNLIHDLHTTAAGWNTEGSMGIIGLQQNLTSGPPLTITNNVIYDITNTVVEGHIAGIHVGSRATSYVLNNTVLRINNVGSGCAPNCGPAWGIYAKAWPDGTGVTVIAQNNYVGNVSAVNPVQVCYGVMDGGVLTQSFNVSSDATATGFSSQTNRTNYATYFQSITNGSENLHIVNTSAALWGTSGSDLSARFSHDVDGQLRTIPWDVGADESNGTTAVKLMSFDATPGDGEVRLAWRTGSELDNLGFHVYRGAAADGPWTRLTKAVVPGLGSSAVGKAYAWTDTGLRNGTRYFYRLEDVDTASRATSHGPVSATPLAGASADMTDDAPGARKRKAANGSACPAWVLAAYASAGGDDGAPPRCTRHGDPEATSFAVLSRDSRQALVELRTGGFYALHEAAGTVRAFVPGLELPGDDAAPALPLRRVLVDAVIGRRVQLAGARASDLAAFPGLVPSAVGAAEMQVSWDGTVRPGRRGGRPARAAAPSELARLLPSVFQGEAKSAVVELVPLRFDAQRRQIVLARAIRVRLLFTGREPGESGSGTRGRAPSRRQPVAAAGEVLAQLHTTSRGLHAVGFEQLFPGERRALSASELRLQRQGAAVAFHVDPDRESFGPGSRLFFFAETGAASTAFTNEVAYELVRSSDGRRMPRASAAPSGPGLTAPPRGFAGFEANRFYQPGLLDAPDPWLWEALTSGVTRPLSFTLSGLDASAAGEARLEVLFQGASESGGASDHHLAVSVNGVPVGGTSFAGKRPHRASFGLPVATLREGVNEIALTNVGDTGVSSLVFLDRFELAFPRLAATAAGRFEAEWSDAGAASVAVAEAPLALVAIPGETAGAGTDPVWLSGYQAGATLRFRAEAGRRYLLATASGALAPRVVRPQPSTLRSTRNQADYLLIAPRAFLPAAEPLLARRADQGLAARGVAAEEIYDAFGYGQPSAEALRAFVAYAFQSWARPSPRYVVLLGDASYDPRNFMGVSPSAPLPALFEKTSYLWTSADPLLAAVNGDDTLPDLALGRLPAATAEEAGRLVEKLLAWEDSAQGLRGRATLVADNPDLAGDFEANIADVAASFLADRQPELLRLRELGAATRPRILDALNSGLALLSYVGHGGAAVWASENVWNSWDATSLQAQSRQPLLMTWNCLNGYFVAPTFDSLAESLVKVEGRGAIAAVSPSGLSLDAQAHEFHRALVAELVSGRHARLGDAFLAAQTAYARTGLMPELVSVYHLFGDPGMVLQ